ncbi:MAG: hypothetical protein R6X08_12170 [Desulfosalsimonadaceae bacterium]
MIGIEAIIQHDGFSMAAVGITIVFTALVTLSLIISQLHRVLTFWDNRAVWKQKIVRMFAARQQKEGTGPELQHVPGAAETARQFFILVQAMGEPFSLPWLILKAEACGIRHPHAKVSRLIEENLIMPDEKGFFVWNHAEYNRPARWSR